MWLSKERSLTTCEAGTRIWRNAGNLFLSPGVIFKTDVHNYDNDACDDDDVYHYYDAYYENNVYDDNDEIYWYLHAGQDKAVANKVSGVTDSFTRLKTVKKLVNFRWIEQELNFLWFNT